MRLQGKASLVTGAGSGIGRETALLFAKEGADVIVNDISGKRANQTALEVEKLGRKTLAIKADVSQSQQVKGMIEEALRQLQRVDILVNNAGIGEEVSFLETTEESWRRMFATHMEGTFYCTKGVLPGMIERKWGRIISISSVAGLTGEAGLVHYSAAKAAIVGFTKALAKEVASFGVTVNAVAPGVIQTPGLGVVSEEMRQRFIKSTPVGRLGQPVDIAAACAYLSSEEASFVTGQVLSPNGGFYT